MEQSGSTRAGAKAEEVGAPLRTIRAVPGSEPPPCPPLTVPVLPATDDQPRAYRGGQRAFATRLFHRVAKALDRQIVGLVEFVGEGLWHHAWQVGVVAPPVLPGHPAREKLEFRTLAGANPSVRPWILRIPHGPHSPLHDARLLKEARLLPWVVAEGLPVPVPRPVALIGTLLGLASVQTRVDGVEAPETHRFSATAETACAVHALPAPPGCGRIDGPIPAWMEGWPTRRDHALDRLAVCRQVPLPEARAAAAWVEAHLPPATPACLLHGDLMRQNLRQQGDAWALIDWAEALAGDPAYDFAIVTRGVRRPLGEGGARRRLLDLYHAAGGDPGLTMPHIYLQELALTVEWLAVAATPQVHDEALARLRRMLKHLGA